MPALISLPDAKNILNVRDGDQEDLIKALIEGVTSVIEHEVGAVTERSVTMDVRHRGSAVALPEANIMSLESAVDARSGAVIDISGMYVDDAGILHGNLPAAPWRLTARVGMDPIPAAITAAARETLKEAWAIRLGPETQSHQRPFLISYRTMVWLEPYRTGPGLS